MMHVLHSSQPLLFQGTVSSNSRAFKPLSKADTLKTDSVQWSKPGLKTGGSVKFSARPGETQAPQQRGSWGGWIKKGAIGLLLATAGKPALAYGCNQKAGDTPLIKLAQSSGSLEQAKSLIDQKKINPIQKDSCGHTAQYYAEQMQHSQLAQYLENIHTEMVEHFTRAVKYNNKDRVSRLLAQGLDINECDSKGNTALMIAVTSGKRDMADYLRKQGATIDCNNYFKHVKRLLQRGENLDRENALGETPVMTASRIGDMESLNALLDVGANTDDYSAALMLAAENGHKEAVIALIDEDADVNQVTPKYDSGILAVGTDMKLHPVEKGGYSALMYAAKNGHTEIVQILLDAGADPCPKDGFSRNAYDLAQSFKHGKTARILRKATKKEDCNNPLRPVKKAVNTFKDYASPAYEVYQTVDEIRQRVFG